MQTADRKGKIVAAVSVAAEKAPRPEGPGARAASEAKAPRPEGPGARAASEAKARVTDAAAVEPEKTYPPIEKVQNDELTDKDMMFYLYAAIDGVGINSHNLESYNRLVNGGLEHIIESMFKISKNLRNERPQEKDHKNTRLQIHFTRLEVGKPVYQTSQGQVDLLPGHARLSGHPYAGPVKLAATVTLTASYADGHEEVKVAEIPEFIVGHFPIMVGSSKCHTANLPREALKGIHDDPLNPKGEFVYKTNEYIVSLVENIRFNELHIHLRSAADEVVRAEFISQPGGNPFENSSQLIVRYMTSGAITIEINSTRLQGCRFPFYLIYRMLGMTSDRDIVATIVHGMKVVDGVAEGRTLLETRMLTILEKAMQMTTSSKEQDTFAKLKDVLNREEIIQTVAEKLSKFLKNATYSANENAVQYLNNDLIEILDRVICSHLGVTPASRALKLREIGLWIQRALLVALGVATPTDRDSIAIKNAHGPLSLAKTFKTHFNNSVVLTAIRAVRMMLRNNSFGSLTSMGIADAIVSRVASSDLSRAMGNALTSGESTLVIRGRTSPNRLDSTARERKNYLEVVCSGRNIFSSGGGASKQTMRADMMRRVHATFNGYVCVAQSADTGENVGMRKQLAITATVCEAGEPLLLERHLLADPAVTPIGEVTDARIAAEHLARVSVNGKVVGICRSGWALADRFRRLRRESRIVDPKTSIVWNCQSDRVDFHLDIGRLVRPLLIVDNNLADYDAARSNANAAANAAAANAAAAPVRFCQNTRFTPWHVAEIRAGRLTLEDLRREGVVEFITPQEQESCFIAESIEVLRRDRHNVAKRYTHVDVPQALLGFAAHLSMFGNHTQVARVTFETNQGRQTCGWFAMNFGYIAAKNRFFQVYNETPLVSTITSRYILPNGLNVETMYAILDGDNQEDSGIVCKGSADRFMFGGWYYRHERVELEKGEYFRTPNPLDTKNLKPNASYEHLVDGVVRVGTHIERGDVLIGRVAQITRGRGESAAADSKYQYVDRSVVYRGEESCIVDAVVRSTGANDEKFILVKLRFERPLRVGDKGCLTADHEVLTSHGWKPVADVTMRDSVAVLEEGQRLGYARPTELFAYDHKGPIYEIDSQLVSQKVTLDHRMYVKVRSIKADNDYKLVRASEIKGKRVNYKRNATNVQPDQLHHVLWGETEDEADVELPMDPWLDLLGAFISDGFTQAGRKNVAVLSMVKQRKVDFATQACERLGVKYRYGNAKFEVLCPRIWRELGRLSVGAVNKRLPEYVWELSQRQARVLMASLIQGDGTRDKSHMRYFTSSKGLADDVQRLALHCGWSANAQVRYEAGHEAKMAEGRVITATADAWVVTIITAKNEPQVNTGQTNQLRMTETVSQFDGKVYCLTVPSHVFYVRRRGVPGWTGNSSRAGNKFITAKIVAQSDMPYTADGTTPDIIINPASLPTRMTVGQQLETSLAKVCAHTGKIADGTTFLKVSHDDIARALVAMGCRANGRELMFNGRTGEPFEVSIFMGKTYQQRLQKFVADECYAVGGSGSRDPKTGQPLGGKHANGGLRIGEMEQWCFASHGSMLVLFEKFSQDSDGCIEHVCRVCGKEAIYNEQYDIYQCRQCGEAADICAVQTTKSAALFRQELEACNIRFTRGLSPRSFETRPEELAPKKGGADTNPSDDKFSRVSGGVSGVVKEVIGDADDVNPLEVLAPPPSLDEAVDPVADFGDVSDADD